MVNRGELFFLFILVIFTFSFISATQQFLNKTISYEYGKFKPELRNSNEIINHFKKLDLQENFTYVLLQFQDSATEKQIKQLEKGNIKQIGKYSKDLYIYKFPKEILETQTYDFIEWIDVPKKLDKMNNELKDSLNLNNSLYVKIEFYENYTDDELIKINKYAKFSNKDDWEEKEIYVLVSPKINLNSIHPIEEIASFNFVKSVRLIDIRDRRQINLYINQSDFYVNKSLINQPHAICPWQRENEINNKKITKIVSQNVVSEDYALQSLEKNHKLIKTQSYVEISRLGNIENYFEVIEENGEKYIIMELDSENNFSKTFLVASQSKNTSFLIDLKLINNSYYITFFDENQGVRFDFFKQKVVSSWGLPANSCTGNQCLLYGIEYLRDNGDLGICLGACISLSLETLGTGEIICLGCLLSLGINLEYHCIVDNCYYYPCQQDCNDNDGWGSWNYYCSSNDVWRRKQFTDYECSSSSPMEGGCYVDGTYWGQNEFYDSCSYGCTSGSCDSEIECYSDSDCPADGWVGSTYCSGGDVWQTWRNYYCSSNNCYYSDSGQQKRDCSNGCTNGECDETEECAWDELEEDCDFDAEDAIEMEIANEEADDASGTVYICGENDCSEIYSFAANFDIGDCDGELDETMKNNIIETRLKWWNDGGEEDCSNTDLYWYNADEDNFNSPEVLGEELTDLDEWFLVDEGMGSCMSGYNSLDITSQFIDDLTSHKDEEIAYGWIPEDTQELWYMDSWSDPYLDVDYCKPCPDEDNDNYHDEDENCGTGDDCDDYNLYINPGANIYCDCNSGTGGGATQGINEICDNIDNDCDGSTDESLSQGCGIGICSGGTQSCSAGSWGSCSTNYLATNETCNNLDDDCDGSVDESLIQECGTDIGECVKGTQTCSIGSWGNCTGTYIGPTNETCNGLDDNCNGIIDEDNVCGDYPNTTIISPINNYIISTGNITFNCSSFDDEGLANITLYHNITGNMTANWTKNITGISNSTTWTINNISDGTNFIWNCLVYDNDSHWSWSENGPYYIEVAVPTDTHKFYIYNSTGNPVAWLGDKGNIVLKGSCFSGGSCDNSGQNSLIIRNITDDNVAFINSTGDLCVETGDCSDENATCDTNPQGAFIIRNSSDNNVIYIDRYGELCLTGKLYQNSNL